MKPAATTTIVKKPTEARVVERGIRYDLMLSLGEFVPTDEVDCQWDKLMSVIVLSVGGFDAGNANKI